MSRSTPPTPTLTPPTAAASASSTRTTRGRVAEQNRTAIVTGILCIVLILGLMQLWLLTATMNAYLGGDHAVAWPALGASVVCLVLNLGLLRYLSLVGRAR